MLTLQKNEKVLLVVRKHWFLMVGPIITFAVLLLIPVIVLTLLPLVKSYAGESFNFASIEALVSLGLALWSMFLLLFIFLIWTVYYLDMWIITDERIIDIEQHGLFSREISEIPLHRVQDVTIEIHGLIETFLKFGTIRIQTAGEREFVIKNVPQLYEIKDIILRYSHPQSIAEKPRS